MKRKPSPKLTISLAIIGLYLLGALLAPHFVDKEGIDNWYNGNYWIRNPRLAPPEWVNLFGSKKPPSRILKPTKEEGRLHVFEYDFHYSRTPQDIKIIFNKTKFERISITLTTPGGESYVLYNSPIIEELSFRASVKKLIEIGRDKGMDVTETDVLFGDALKPLFFKNESGRIVPDEGKYRITIVSSAKPQVFVVGKVYGLMGTDVKRRDLWVGFLWGLRETMILVILTSLLATFLGTLLGVSGGLSGAAGVFSDAVSKISAITPLLPVMIALVPVEGKVGPNGILQMPMGLFILILGFLLSGKISRNVKVMVETEIKKEYIESSVSLGGDRLWILRNHILKVVIPYGIYQLTLLVPRVVALISLLGFFRATPGFNWGTLMASVVIENPRVTIYWWEVLPITLALGIFALAFVLINRDMEDRMSSKNI
ncbi:ABC transporter permease subunit [Thermococcus gorgonarius]|uniref:Peptide ABC transporter permease n=1 Tax=Thermococcus gorgonarius TaxID=71997 RepID=A0A2Z2M688_THEGO|nr:ABC transporter permease subunit [Thermococcus gorgonarius]ASJ01597.1 peptide ABC transporter permease [Thermococcus gorgonarius]